MKVKKGVSQLDQGSGVFTQSDKEVADVLNEYFTSVYTHEPTGSLPDFEYLVDERNFVTDLIITEQVVHKKLGNLKENKAPGPRPVARGGSGGQLTPPLRTKGPLFGTSRVKLLRPITING